MIQEVEDRLVRKVLTEFEQDYPYRLGLFRTSGAHFEDTLQTWQMAADILQERGIDEIVVVHVTQNHPEDDDKRLGILSKNGFTQLFLDIKAAGITYLHTHYVDACPREKLPREQELDIMRLGMLLALQQTNR